MRLSISGPGLQDPLSSNGPPTTTTTPPPPYHFDPLPTYPPTYIAIQPSSDDLSVQLKELILFFQFTSWVDAVIFVFSLENEASFNAIYNYYAKMCQYRNMQEIPLILVGTQGKYNNIITPFFKAINLLTFFSS